MRARLRRALWCLAALVAAAALPAVCAQSQITNVKDLRAAVYTEMDFSRGGDACVRLLNASGTIGCATPGRQPTEGRLQRLDALLPSSDDYPGACTVWWMLGWVNAQVPKARLPAKPATHCAAGAPSSTLPPSPPPTTAGGTTFLLPPALLAGFLQQCAASPSLASRVAGVLVEPQPAPDYSQAERAPLAELALYADRGYAWNPSGEWVAWWLACKQRGSACGPRHAAHACCSPAADAASVCCPTLRIT